MSVQPDPLTCRKNRDTMRRADAKLYAAKHAGRNRLECETP